MNIMDVNSIKQQILIFEKARNNLLAVIAFTVINLILAVFDAGVYFLFSATLPQFVFEIGRNLDFEMGTSIFMILGLIIAIIIIIPYFVFWILAKRARILILVALIFFGIDSLFLLFLILGTEFEFSYLLEIAFHVWILYYLIIGVSAWAKIRNIISTDNFNIFFQELKSKNIASNDIEVSDSLQQEKNEDDNSTNN
jgi:hypothetical protein